MLTIRGRSRTYWPHLFNYGFTLIWLHSCSHCSVERCSSRCCSVMDLFLSKTWLGSGIFQSFTGWYTNELGALTATYQQFCL